MYTPPIKGIIFPSKNPFYNGQIVDYAAAPSQYSEDKHTSLMNDTAYGGTMGRAASTCASSLIKPNQSNQNSI